MAKRLERYRQKRDFTKTREPSGGHDRDVAASDNLRFVIHKHDARRLHYDLRLEWGGVFHSWAVTRGPSLDPGEKRLAVEVEEHPLAYGDFEGTIPKGEYGGGTVMIWDRGFWAPEETNDVERAIAGGELKFALAGERVQGSFVLVRLKPKAGDTKRNWLLIKHRDTWATPGRDDVLDETRSVASGREMSEIASGERPEAQPFMTRTQGKSKGHKARPAREKFQTTPAKPPRLSNPDRVLWPDNAWTKRDHADYLLAVSEWMLPHLRGRPCSLLRAPDGTGAATFFQRHVVAGLPDGVTRIVLAGDREPYIQIDDAQTLVDLAQFSAIEFHPWNNAPFDIDHPGRLVFDLDPGPGVAFDDVVAAARDVKQTLEQLGLVTFCKTTGGKGLHVVTPLTAESGIGFEQAKLFSQTIAARLAEREPKRFVAKMTKRIRAGRIFIDYLRNDTKSTAVAPLSPRARPGALVSMPLNWSQVKKGLDPTRFDIKSAPGLLRKSSPWSDYDSGARLLSTAVARLLEA